MLLETAAADPCKSMHCLMTSGRELPGRVGIIEVMTMTLSTIRQRKAPDDRDRLILALYAELKAERQTRQALEAAIRNGSVSMEVLEAMAADPVPVVTDSDIAAIETFLAEDDRRGEV